MVHRKMLILESGQKCRAPLSFLDFGELVRKPVQTFVETIPLGSTGGLDVPLKLQREKVNNNN
jgi:hypothetical protein